MGSLCRSRDVKVAAIEIKIVRVVWYVFNPRATIHQYLAVLTVMMFQSSRMFVSNHADEKVVAIYLIMEMR